VLAGHGGPNWVTGSPQHFVVGAVLALAVYWSVRSDRIGLPEWAAVAVAVGFVGAGELVWEIVEYEVRYAGHFHYSAYYDTLADLANSFAGAIVGAAVGVAWERVARKR
jgi:hypothetical protein